MRARKPGSVRRLAGIATIIAIVATVMVAYIVLELSRDAASDSVVIGPLVLFSGTCFVLAWPSTFLAGWLLLRRGPRR